MTAATDSALARLGAGLSAHPRMAGSVLAGLRGMPTRRLRAVTYHAVARPLARGMTASLVVPVFGTLRMTADLSDVMGRMVATSGVWEPHVTAAFRAVLRPGDVCVDVGAHVGYYTLLASQLVGPAGRVYAVEPDPENHGRLRANLALNGVANVTPLRVAAGAADGEAVLTGEQAGNTGWRRVRDAAEVGDAGPPLTPVHVCTVPSLLEPSDRPRVRLVKIDVEGYEAPVLLGLESLYSSGARPLLLVELHGADAEDGARVLERLCASYGLVAYELVEGESRRQLSPPPPPRPLSSPLEPVSIYSGRGCNLLVKPIPA